MNLPNNWTNECAQFLQERMSSRFSQRMPHLGVVGPPFPEQVRSYNDNEFVASLENSTEDKESASFRYAPNTTQVEFSTVGKGILRFHTSFYYRKRDGTHIVPLGHEYNKDEDPSFFSKAEINIEYHTEDFSIRGNLVVDGVENVLDIKKINEGHSDRYISNIYLQSDSFPRRKEGINLNPAPYNFNLKIDLKISPLVTDQIRIKYRFTNESKEGLVGNQKEGKSEQEDYTYYYGPIYEFSSKVSLDGITLKESREGKKISRINNLTYEETGREIILKDSKIISETISRLNLGSPPKYFFKILNDSSFMGEKRKHYLSEILANTFSDEQPQGLGFRNLRLFQELAINKIMDSWELSERGIIYPVVIKTRTAAGKTEAFLIPTLQFCLKEMEQKKVGTNSIIFYPTKALANDQANRFHKILYYLNKKSPNKMTLGVLHGDINKDEVNPDYFIYTCPICDRKLKYNEDDGTLRCSDHKEVIIDYIYLTKREIYSNPPNILVTNPDMINYLLLSAPEGHSILGRSVGYCSTCGKTYASVKKSVCDECRDAGRKHSIKICSPTTVPRFIIFDEIHLLKGTLGSHVSYLISRLKKIISEYNKRIDPERSYAPVLIGSTATIKDSQKFSEELFGTKDIFEIPKDAEESEKIYNQGSDNTSIHRQHLFVMPFSYTPETFTSMCMKRIWDWWQNQSFYKDDNTKRPRVLVFVNSIGDANNLIQSITNQVPTLKVDGHNTDFRREDRVKVEKEFNKGELDVLIATKTLEVGVDFEDINILLIFGSPFSYNDYLQRIGRAGRKSNALVINVFKPSMPIDNFYYENCETLVLQEKREKNIEAIPIKRQNEKVIRKTHTQAVIDFLMLEESAYALQEDTTKILHLLEDSSQLEYIRSGVKLVLAECFNEMKFTEVIEGLKSDVGQAIRTSSKYTTLFKIINQRENITNMRYADKEIPLKIEPFRNDPSGDNKEIESEGFSFVRSRPLGYCISKLFKDAATSYRGVTLQVEEFTTAKTFQLDDLLYSQLYRRVVRNPFLRRNNLLPFSSSDVFVHEPKAIMINWGVFNILKCSRCGHLHRIAPNPLRCKNCNSKLTSAPVIVMVNRKSNFREPEIIKMDNKILLSMQRQCKFHGLVMHLKTINDERPTESLSWVCPICRPDLINGGCSLCKDYQERQI